MEKALRRELGLGRRTWTYILAGIALFLVVSVSVYGLLYREVKKEVMGEAETYISDISELNAQSVHDGLDRSRTLLESFAYNLSLSKSDDYQKIISKMGIYRKSYGFHDMGLLTTDGVLYTTDGQTIDVSGRKEYMDALLGDFQVSESIPSADDEEMKVNLLSVPVYYGDDVEYMLTATCHSGYLTEKMNAGASKGKGYNFIVNEWGRLAVSPSEDSDISFRGLIDYVDDNVRVVPKENESIRFVHEGVAYYAHFQSLDMNGWFLMTCMEENRIFARTDRILSGLLCGMGILGLQVAVFLVVLLLLVVRIQKRIKGIVFYDELLGIRKADFLKMYFPLIPKDELEHKALIVFDVDKFKEFNYIYGEQCGDGLLSYISKVFGNVLPDDMLFRYLGDHFVLLAGCDGEREAEEKLRLVLERIAIDIDKGEIQPFDLSIGVRMLDRHMTYGRAFSDALVAKRTVKNIQIQKYAIYDESMRHKRVSYLEMESDFHKALKEGEFQVYYQPKVDMNTGIIMGSEALARWVKPDGTMISPAEFIPCFEESRQIILLDRAIFETVCRHMMEMKREGIPVRSVSVNLSRAHLRHPEVINKIAQVIHECGIEASKLAFEVTESAVYEDAKSLREIVDRLHSLGCKVYMDDYGTGVSCTSLLADVDFDVLKMDKSFVDRIGDRKMDSVIRSTINLSAELGMAIVAEGVETRKQAERLTSWGCVYAQGYFYSKPVPVQDYREMLRKGFV